MTTKQVEFKMHIDLGRDATVEEIRDDLLDQIDDWRRFQGKDKVIGVKVFDLVPVTMVPVDPVSLGDDEGYRLDRSIELEG